MNIAFKSHKAWLSACALIGTLLPSGPLAAAPTEAQAKQTAQERFSKACLQFDCKAAAYSGPSKTTVAGAAFAYRWTSTAATAPKEFLIYTNRNGGWITTVRP